MLPGDPSDTPVAAANPFTVADVVAILRERGRLAAEPSLEQDAWCERAALVLGGHASDRAALADLLDLVFQYDAREIISRVESHVVLSRYAARDVLRQVGLLLLDGDGGTARGGRPVCREDGVLPGGNRPGWPGTVDRSVRAVAPVGARGCSPG